MASAFNPKNENLFATLCGTPDWQVLLWDWEKMRLLTKVGIGLQGPVSAKPCNFEMSWNPFEHDATKGMILVTGPQNTFKTCNFSHDDKGDHLTIGFSQIKQLEESRKISPNYTCHGWGKQNGYILVCTDNGEMIVCQNSGEFKAYVLDSPVGETIEALVATEHGFLIATENAFRVFVNDSGDDRVPLRPVGERSVITMANNEPNHIPGSLQIESMCLNEKET